MHFSIVELIEAMLAPGLMISACGLLLLGMNNKYSLVVSRLRTLDEEKRTLLNQKEQEDLSPDKNKRLNSIIKQLEKFEYRIKLVKNAVVSYSIAVGFFILASLFIGAQLAIKSDLSMLPLIFFLAGMLSVLFGIIFAAREVMKGYEIVEIEVSNV